MTDFKHLTEYELSAYHSCSLEKKELNEIGRHLLMCADCRKMLPLPSVEKFWAAILTDNEQEENHVDERVQLSFSSIFTYFWNLHSNLILGSAALVLLLSFTFVIWLNNGKEATDVAQTFEINNDLNSGLKFPAPIETPSIDTGVSSKNSNRDVVKSTTKQTKSELPKPKLSTGNIVNSSINGKNPKGKQDVISSTRGVSAKCSDNLYLQYELTGEKDNFVFKWKKVFGAAKYHLYISDDEEILIDEYETTGETTFVLNKQLDPLKTYKWKIIITMENGQTVAGPSNKFMVRDFQTKQTRPEKKEKSEVRCSAND